MASPDGRNQPRHRPPEAVERACLDDADRDFESPDDWDELGPVQPGWDPLDPDDAEETEPEYGDFWPEPDDFED